MGLEHISPWQSRRAPVHALQFHGPTLSRPVGTQDLTQTCSQKPQQRIDAGDESPPRFSRSKFFKDSDQPFPKGGTMSRLHSTGIAALAFAALTAGAQAQAPAQPPFATTKVDGTENVYIFRYGGHQSMFVVTSAGVIATDPIGLRRPAAKAYIEEIQKITKAPIKY